jgi:predicted acyltransferase
MASAEKAVKSEQNEVNFSTSLQEKKSSRLVSLDSLRGFTMFMIIGGDTLIKSLESFGHFKITDFLVRQVDHSPWEGFRYYDCIWPCFMLMVGVSIPFAFAKRSLTQSYPVMLWHAITRFAILFLLGSLRESVSSGSPHLIELSSALQPIAVAYLVSFIIVRKSWKFQATVGLLILLIYGMAVALIPVPGVGSGSYVRNANLVWFMDQTLLPGRIEDDVFLEGWGTMISMIPAISTTILGLLMGRLLMNKKTATNYKLRILAITCAGVLATGYVISIFVPVVMKMWTVSYGLISAGWACTMLLIFYWFIDVLGHKKWTYFFVVIGVNALAIYLADTVMRLSTISDVFTKDLAELMGSFGPLFSILVFIGLEWIILNWMYKRKIFLTP